MMTRKKSWTVAFVAMALALAPVAGSSIAHAQHGPGGGGPGGGGHGGGFGGGPGGHGGGGPGFGGPGGGFHGGPGGGPRGGPRGGGWDRGGWGAVGIVVPAGMDRHPIRMKGMDTDMGMVIPAITILTAVMSGAGGGVGGKTG